MSFSYDNTQISASGTNYISFVRFAVDDKNSTLYTLEDEEIDALYDQTSSADNQIQRNYQTAVWCAEYLLVRYSKMPSSWSSAGTSVTNNERLKALQQLLDRLRLKLLAIDGVSPMLYTYRPLGFKECW